MFSEMNMVYAKSFGLLTVGLVFVLLLAGMMPAQSRTAVADSARDGNAEAVRELLKKGVDVNAAHGDGMTPLHWAAFKDNLEIAEMLIYAGANVEAGIRINLMTPLFLAAQNGNRLMVNTLLSGGANPNAAMTTGTTPLMIAAAAGDPDALEALLDAGADPNKTEEAQGQTALMFAASFDRTEAIKVLIKNGADASLATKVVDVGKRTASSSNRSGLTRTRGAQSGQTRGRGGNAAAGQTRGRGSGGKGSIAKNAPLFSASGIPINKGNAGSLNTRALVGSGSGPAARATPAQRVSTLGGTTALLFAARQGHLNSVRTLLEEGVDINRVSSGDKSSALLVATINGHFDLANFMLENGADPSLASNAGATPLYAAINVRWAPEVGYPQPDTSQQNISYLNLMKRFIDNGADVNSRLKKELWYTSYTFDLSRVDAAGATAFWRAAQVADVNALRLLNDHGADPTIATENDVMPVHVATGGGVHGNDEVIVPGGWMPALRYLVDELEADVNVVDSKGYTPLHNAAGIGHNEIVQFLFDRGANVRAVSKDGETVADMANGPRQRIQPFPETIQLLLSMGSPFSEKCLSC